MKKSELNAFVAKGEDSQQQFKQNIRNPNLSARKIGNTLGISSRAVEKHLSNLQRDGRLHRIGPANVGVKMETRTPEEIIHSIDAQGKIVAEALEKSICENRIIDDDLKDLKAPCERDNQCLQRKTVLTNGLI